MSYGHTLEIKVTVVIILIVERPSFCPHGDVHEKHCTLINVPVHGEQIGTSPVFIALFSREL